MWGIVKLVKHTYLYHIFNIVAVLLMLSDFTNKTHIKKINVL